MSDDVRMVKVERQVKGLEDAVVKLTDLVQSMARELDKNPMTSRTSSTLRMDADFQAIKKLIGRSSW